MDHRPQLPRRLGGNSHFASPSPTITRHPSPASPLTLLLSWKSSSLPTPHLCLDLRPAQAFHARHLAPSTNIPGDELRERWFELPAKQTIFAVVEPAGGGGFADWLVAKGWCVPWVFQGEDEDLWREAQRIGILRGDGNPTRIYNGDAVSDKTDQSRMPPTALEGVIDLPVDLSVPSKPWFLFTPCPFLADNIALIERSLSLRLPASPSPRTLRCLDIGCGSGRDVAWLLSRDLTSASWTVTALDAWAGAVERTLALIKSMGLAERVECLAQAKVMADGGWRLIAPAVWPGCQNERGMNLTNPNIVQPTPTLPPPSKASVFSPGLPTPTFFAQLLSASPISHTPSPTFDLILTIRFLSRPLLPHLPLLLSPGGFLLVSHFVDDLSREYDTPRPEHRLRSGELGALYGRYEGLEIVADVVEEVEDGRPVNSVLVRRVRGA